MPDPTEYRIPEEAPIRPDQKSSDPHVTHRTSSGYEIDIYDLALTVQGMMLNSMISDGISPNYNSPEEIMAILQDELHRYGQEWHEKYLARCYDVSITDTEEVEGVPYETKMQDTLYEAALVHASEMFWGFVSRHATRREVRFMDEDLRSKYLAEDTFSLPSGDVIRRVPEAFTPEGEGVMFFPEFPGRPDWISREDSLRTTRLIRDLEEMDPHLPSEYSSEKGR